MYESFYGLSANPFRLSPSPDFFYSSDGHKRALAYLRYGVSRGEGFIVITGGIGVGKTTLAGALLQGLQSNDVVAGQLVSTRVGPTAILGMVCNVFGLPYSDKTRKAELLKIIHQFLRICYEQGKRVLLLVDEAQNLPVNTIEELRMLSNFMIDNQPLLQTFLLGQEEFLETITGPGMDQLRQRVIASYHLRPLSEAEVYDYVYHRLKTAGWLGYEIFTREACREIHQATGGVPRKINVLCDRALLFGCLEETKLLDAPQLREVINELAGEPTAFQNQASFQAG